MGSRIIATVTKFDKKYNLQKAIANCTGISTVDEGQFPVYVNIGEWQVYLIAGRLRENSRFGSTESGILAAYDHYGESVYVKIFDSPKSALKEQTLISNIAYSGYREDVVNHFSNGYLKIPINLVSSEWW